MFAGTLRDNIGLGDAALDDERILTAARRVGADRVIASPPGGPRRARSSSAARTSRPASASWSRSRARWPAIPRS